MLLCDLAFPQNVSFLTYKVPDNLRECIKEGDIVEAPLRKQIKPALVLRIYEGRAEGLKEVLSVKEENTPFTADLLRLLRWMTEYYLTTEGLVLKNMHFKEYLHTPKRKIDISPRRRPLGNSSTEPIQQEVLNSVIDLCCKKQYTGVVLMNSSVYQLRETVREIVLGVRPSKVLILAPDVKEAEQIFALLSEIDSRVCLFHGNLSRSRKSLLVRMIAQGEFNVVVGTRSAALLPFKGLSLIVVTHEHSYLYKQEETPRYNARDVAVMRGYISEVPVVLATTTPSTESYYNCLKGKYHFLKLAHTGRQKVSVQILKKYHHSKDPLTGPLIEQLKSALKRHQNILLLYHRLGYSMLVCQECGFLFLCELCRKPMMLHVNEGLLCHSCAMKQPVPASCPRCGGYHLGFLGTGIEYIQRRIAETLKTVPLRLDSDVDEFRQGLVLGTLKRVTLSHRVFSLIAFVNPDLFLNLPEYRAIERFMQEVFYLKDMLSEGGKMVFVTSLPGNTVFRYIKNWDYIGFIKEELRLRRSSGLPPYSRAVTFSLHLKTREYPDQLLEDLKASVKARRYAGPVVKGSTLKNYRWCTEITLFDRTHIVDAVETFKGLSKAYKALLRIDVDPLGF